MNGVPITRASFPLLPVDATGQALHAGSVVSVLTVESCARNLPENDQQRLRAIVGQSRQIIKFDDAGFVWLSSDGAGNGDFCLFPHELALLDS